MKIEDLVKGEIYRYNGFTDYFFQFDYIDGDYIIASYAISVMDKEIFGNCRLSRTSFYYRGVSTVDDCIREWLKCKISYYEERLKKK